jgi:hypothetical protein
MSTSVVVSVEPFSYDDSEYGEAVDCYMYLCHPVIWGGCGQLLAYRPT